MNKKFITLISMCSLMVMSGMSAFSQTNGNGSQSGAGSISGYGALTIMTTSLFGSTEWDVLTGIRGGITLDNQFTIGLVGASTAGAFKVESKVSDISRALELQYAGVFFEYSTLKPNSTMHFSIPVELVVGHFNIKPDNDDGIQVGVVSGYGSEGRSPLVFYSVIPGVNWDMRFTRFFSLGFHAGYRLTFFDDNQAKDEKYFDFIDDNYDLWGIQAGVIFRFGKF